jgi:hypothetical protein
MTETTKTRTFEKFRAIADKGVAQARVNYDNAEAVSEEASAFYKDSYTTATKGTTDYARTNLNAAIDCAHELFAVKSTSEFVELSTAHAQKHFATGAGVAGADCWALAAGSVSASAQTANDTASRRGKVLRAI